MQDMLIISGTQQSIETETYFLSREVERDFS